MKRKIYLLAILSIFFVIFIFRGSLLNSIAYSLILNHEPQKADVMVVLGGNPKGERTAFAAKLWHQGYARKIILSGGPVAWNMTAARLMQRQIIYLGVPKKAILLEEESTSTYENALFSLEIMKKYGFDSVIMITSPYHSKRSFKAFKKVFKRQNASSVKIISLPVEGDKFEVSGWWRDRDQLEFVLLEWFKSLFYLFE